jgi:hypothetical protein
VAKFKAKRTFAHGPNFYYPANKEPYEAPDEYVNNWVNAGYVELIEEPKKAEKVEEKPKAKKKKAGK